MTDAEPPVEPVTQSGAKTAKKAFEKVAKKKPDPAGLALAEEAQAAMAKIRDGLKKKTTTYVAEAEKKADAAEARAVAAEAKAAELKAAAANATGTDKTTAEQDAQAAADQAKRDRQQHIPTSLKPGLLLHQLERLQAESGKRCKAAAKTDHQKQPYRPTFLLHIEQSGANAEDKRAEDVDKQRAEREGI